MSQRNSGYVRPSFAKRLTSVDRIRWFEDWRASPSFKMTRPKQDHPESIAAIGQRLRTLRKALNMTQGEMATAAGSGSGAQMWWNYEVGYRRIRIDHALVLCQHFGLTLEWIYRGNPGMCDPDLMERIRAQELKPAAPAPEPQERIAVVDDNLADQSSAANLQPWFDGPA
jgi:transcriptional regulator with XRE-family HTH domain